MPDDFDDDKSTFVQVMVDAVRQQDITWANVNTDLWRKMITKSQGVKYITHEIRTRSFYK